MNISSSDAYTAKNITVLEGLEAVQKRPGMYVGDTTKAVLQMISEVIDNCVDEHSIGHCKHIWFSYNNGIYSIRDDARGFPVDMHEAGKPAVEIILTTLHSGGKFDDKSYKYSGGLHGVGVSVVNALAKWFEIEVYRNKTIYFMRFEKGKTVIPLETRGSTDLQGTKISFVPDLDILDSEIPTTKEIQHRFQELSYLNSDLIIYYDFEGEVKEFHSSGGMKDLVEKLGKSILETPLHFKTETVETAFFWDDSDNDEILCFTNNIFQIDGGTHLFGFRAALTKVVLPYVETELASGKSKIKKILPEDIRGGLKGAVSVKIMEPRFSSQTKNKLVSAEAKTLVETVISDSLHKFLEKNPTERNKIIKRVIASADMREAVNRSKESVKKAHIDAFSVLPGKLADCQSENPEECEMYIVEGDSAGGSAKGGRNRKTQAILPLRGKPLNVERAHLNRSLACETIITLIAALGTGVAQTFNPDKLRYHKVIIMTDADVDGLHIRCLLIAFFLKLMPEIVERGHVYVARTPLYKISHGKSAKYLQDEEELEGYLFNRFFENHSVESNETKLPIEELKKLISDCTDFKNFVLQKSLTIDSKILSLALVYDIFNTPKLFLENIKNTTEGEFTLENTEEGITLSINSLYGKNIYYIKNYGVNWAIDKFPLIIDGEKIYDPIDFLKIFQKKSSSGISIQRYKGLGEMNPEELMETSLDINKRVIEPLIIEGSTEDAINHMKEVMGNENDRREFVLGHIKEVFGIYLQ